MFLEGRPCPILIGQAPSIPQMFGTSYVHSHSMRNDNQILRVDQTRCEENVYRVDHGMPTLVANLVVYRCFCHFCISL